jgi:serine protease inhibitor
VKLLSLIALLVGACLIPSTNAQARFVVAAVCPTAVTSSQTGDAASMVAAQNGFGFRLFDRIVSANSGKNVFLSPASAAIALDMLYAGARGGTAASMAGTLGLTGMSRTTVLNNASALLAALQSADPKVQLAVADSVWARAGVAFRQEFLAEAQRYFGARVATVDFSSPSAPAQINAWVSCATHGTITKMIDQISADTVMFLMNAVYFHGQWTTSFDPKNTKPQQFTTADGHKVSMSMMSLAGSKFLYAQGANFQTVALPYGKGRFDMVIVLPQAGLSLQAFAPHFTSPLWRQWTTGLVRQKIDLSIPRFKLSNDWNLNGTLSTLGMGAAFGQPGNFTGICPRCKLSYVRQKTYLKIDEKGTTASAVTGIGITATLAYPHFIADHPFLLAIRDTETGAILFMGAINNPEG